jgi:hypothetical protein
MSFWYLVILIAGHAEALTSTLPRFTQCWHDQVGCVVMMHKGGAIPPENPRQRGTYTPGRDYLRENLQGFCLIQKVAHVPGYVCVFRTLWTE